jgi:hypothetical protein
MEIFIFNNQKSGEFGPFFNFLNPWNGFKICKKIARIIILGYSATNNTNLLSKNLLQNTKVNNGSEAQCLFSSIL